MSAKPASLDQIERWMQAVLMHPGGIDEGLASDAATAHLAVSERELGEVIVPSRSQTSAERLEIYVTAYRLRLMECLRAEYSVTQATVGDEVFDALLFGYLQRFPSQSYTLGELGARFPGYLAESPLHTHARPADGGDCWGQFVIELARWERLVACVFDGPGSEFSSGLDVAQLADASGADGLRVRLVGAPDLRLAVFSHPVHRYWHAMRAGRRPAPPAAQTTYLAVHRRQFVVEEQELSRPQHVLLELLVGGSALADALARFAARAADSAIVEAQLHDWFAEWTRLGYFRELVRCDDR